MSKAIRASRRKHHIIYKTTCLVTGRYYIGMHSTDDLNDAYLGSGLRLRRSIAKYGKEQHVRVILEELLTREAASDREKELITPELRADPLCLNCGVGGLGAVDRPQTTAETSAKISARLKEHYASEVGQTTKQRIAETQRRQTRSPETREKMAVAKRGVTFTEEHCAKLSAAKKGRPIPENQRFDPSRPCTIDGIKIYPSKVALAAELGHGKTGARSPNFRYV